MFQRIIITLIFISALPFSYAVSITNIDSLPYLSNNSFFENASGGAGFFGSKGTAQVSISGRLFELVIKDEKISRLNSKTNKMDTIRKIVKTKIGFLTRTNFLFDTASIATSQYLLSSQPSPLTLRIEQPIYSISENESLGPKIGMTFRYDLKGLPNTKNNATKLSFANNFTLSFPCIFRTTETNSSNQNDGGYFLLEPSILLINGGKELFSNITSQLEKTNLFACDVNMEHNRMLKIILGNFNRDVTKANAAEKINEIYSTKIIKNDMDGEFDTSLHFCCPIEILNQFLARKKISQELYDVTKSNVLDIEKILGTENVLLKVEDWKKNCRTLPVRDVPDYLNFLSTIKHSTIFWDPNNKNGFAKYKDLSNTDPNNDSGILAIRWWVVGACDAVGALAGPWGAAGGSAMGYIYERER